MLPPSPQSQHLGPSATTPRSLRPAFPRSQHLRAPSNFSVTTAQSLGPTVPSVTTPWCSLKSSVPRSHGPLVTTPWCSLKSSVPRSLGPSVTTPGCSLKSSVLTPRPLGHKISVLPPKNPLVSCMANSDPPRRQCSMKDNDKGENTQSKHHHQATAPHPTANTVT